MNNHLVQKSVVCQLFTRHIAFAVDSGHITRQERLLKEVCPLTVPVSN